MKCKIPFVELPNSFPKSDVDVYRILEEDGKYYIRLELDGRPMYLTFSTNEIVLHSKELYEMVSREEIDDCSPLGILDEIFYIMLYQLGTKRTQLFLEFDNLFDLITSGKIKDSKRIILLRKRILANYSDSTVIYYVSRRLSKFLSAESIEDVKFNYERAELLVTRSGDLYNIYLTEVQNDLNEIIKKLTSISFIFMPITAIASIYAVDYTNVYNTLINWQSLIFLSPVLILTVLLVIYLRRIKWL
ncbi:CorA family divalent cation transporter [Saccharolobus islandicus]|uniref:Mg2+ transporter protein, CorA family protein n=1 Tax=Saccharolobus islandicus (strain L.D.8.5 / Lassen \|nr:CorA family divalent cation transporter [Sulfolobus islandicus]ADB86243.1 Mg2+ transporter protein, CorA family protein [Sulfolobus islandicus L.D.8.5]